jgi:tRNA 2-thiouridine synthesizing protein D
MKFAIVIHAAPYTSQAPLSALRFCRAALRDGHDITRIFFYSDGVHNVSNLSVVPQDEVNVPAAWAELIEAHGIDAVACVSSAVKRGILGSQEADLHEKPAANLLPGVSIGGLGQLVDASLSSDRVVNFG